jgi:hypothetical protein
MGMVMRRLSEKSQKHLSAERNEREQKRRRGR